MIEKVKDNRIIAGVNAFVEGAFFPLTVAAIAFVSHSLGLDAVGFIVMALMVAYINLFCEDTRPLVPVALIAPTCASTTGSAGGGYGLYANTLIIVSVAIAAVLVIGSIIARLTIQRKWREALKIRTLTIGFLCYGVALLLGGLFSKYWIVDSLIISLTVIATGLLMYCYLSATMVKREDNFVYFAKAAAVAIVQILLQIGLLYLLEYEWGTPLDSAWKGDIVLGWGISNPIGEMLAFLLPAVMYLMHKEKHGYIYYALALLTLVGVYLTLSRCALLVSVPTFGIGVIISCIKSRNRIPYIIITSVLAVAAIVFVLLALKLESVYYFAEFFVSAKFSDNGRFVIWEELFGLFTQYPVFGTGFSAYQIIHGKVSVLHGLAHNTVVQVVSSLGVVGAIAYAIHRLETIKLFALNITGGKIMLAGAILCYIIMGLFDPVMFYANFTVIYTVMLVLAEKSDEKEKKGKEENEDRENLDCVSLESDTKE